MNNIASFRTITLAGTAASLIGIAACLSEGGDTAGTASHTRPISAAQSSSGRSAVDAQYDLDNPDDVFELPAELTEISGLTMLSDGRLAAVQDEEGIVFVIDAATGVVAERIPFGKRGDYEAIEVVGDRLYVLLANGNLIEIRGWQDGGVETERYKTKLKARNDTEGLVLDPEGSSLLIATKEDPGGDLDKKRHRAMYAFDLATKELLPDPVIVIDLESVESMLPDLKSFKPSDLAFHPKSSKLYVLSSNDQALVILNEGGKVAGVRRLDPNRFEQPEGITFSLSGELFISSEGVKGPAKLFRFVPRS